MKHPVLVDIYPWALACEKQGAVAMEGIFRHADFLAQKYEPAYAVVLGEHVPHEGIKILTDYLRKPIVALQDATWSAVSGLIEGLGCKVWVSLAIDFVCPVICQQTPFKKVTIAHDMLAASGEFGPVKEQQAKRGLQWNDIFAYISVSTLHEVSCHELTYSRPCKFIKYGCFHTYSSLPVASGYCVSGLSLSVHSLYRRKNIEKVFALANKLGTTHYHIGQRYDSPSPTVWEQLLLNGLRYMGPVPDSTLHSMYSKASVFISMSSAEGFNMPPMEAILWGVPSIYLSDTLINREIYGALTGVAFCSLDAPRAVGIDNVVALPLSKEDRGYVFEKYSLPNVTKNLENYLAEIAGN